MLDRVRDLSKSSTNLRNGKSCQGGGGLKPGVILFVCGSEGNRPDFPFLRIIELFEWSLKYVKKTHKQWVILADWYKFRREICN